MNSKQIESFLNSEAGRRMMSHFQAEVDREQKAAKAAKEAADAAYRKQVELEFGKPDQRNASLFRVVEGHLVRITTDERAQVKKMELVRNINELNSTEFARVMEVSPKHGHMLQDGLTLSAPGENFYEVKVAMLNKPLEQAETLVNRPTPENDPNWFQAYDSYADYRVGLTKDMKAAGIKINPDGNLDTGGDA